MTRLRAIRALRSGQPLTHAYLPDDCGTSVQFQLTLSYREHCDFKRRYQEAHHGIGPAHALVLVGRNVTPIAY